jgi:hypothetical protein
MSVRFIQSDESSGSDASFSDVAVETVLLVDEVLL